MVTAPAPPPRQPTRLIGRERELAAARELLLGSQARILTLTGVGGTGKTRLALALAADLRAEFDGHVVWAGLASVAGGAQVPRAIAAALGMIEAPGTPLLDRLTHRLAAPPSLLVLDN